MNLFNNIRQLINFGGKPIEHKYSEIYRKCVLGYSITAISSNGHFAEFDFDKMEFLVYPEFDYDKMGYVDPEFVERHSKLRLIESYRDAVRVFRRIRPAPKLREVDARMEYVLTQHLNHGFDDVTRILIIKRFRWIFPIYETVKDPLITSGWVMSWSKKKCTTYLPVVDSVIT